MSVAFGSHYGIQNAISGDGIITVSGTFDAASTTFNLSLNPTIFKRPGRYVVIKANTVSNLASTIANVTWTSTSQLTAKSVSQETVNFGGTTFPCIVVTVN